MSAKWLKKTTNENTGKYFIVKGTAYVNVTDKTPGNKRLAPSARAAKNALRDVARGKNNPDERMKNRETYYNDPVVRLSRDDLDEIEGAQGAPLCYKHRREDVVGSTHHTYLVGDKMQIIARIPLNDRGKRVLEEIKEGKLRGFSVKYNNEWRRDDDAVLAGKQFEEISLVEEPFFEGCDLSSWVVADSKEEQQQQLQGNLGNKTSHLHNNHSRNPYLLYNYSEFIPFDMSSESAPPAPAAAAAPPAAAAAPAPTQNAETKELLGQTDLLAQRLQEEAAARKAAESKEGAMKKRHDMLHNIYMESQKKRFDEYVKLNEEAIGGPMPADQKAKHWAAFSNPEFKDDADYLYSVAKNSAERSVSVAAAKRDTDTRAADLEAQKKAAEDRAAKMEQELNNYKETMRKSAQTMRTGYAAAMSTPPAAQADPVAAGREEEASNVSADEIMCVNAAPRELRWLREMGYSGSTSGGVSVIAGEDGEETALSQLRRSVPRAADPDVMIAKGESALEMSMRNGPGGAPAWFHFLASSGITRGVNFDDYVNKRIDTSERLAVDAHDGYTV